jgi:hypothetical protein
MNKEIDGTNSAEESARLSRLLTDDTEAKTLFEEMRELHKLLNSVGNVEPPRSLHAHIVNALPQPRQERGSAFSWNRFSGLFHIPAPRPAFVLTLLAGIVAGLAGDMLVFHQPTGSGESISQVVGTTLAVTPVNELTPLASTHVGINGADFTLELSRSGEAILVKVKGSTAKKLLVQLQFPENEISLNSFHRFGGEGNGFLSTPGILNLTAEGHTDIGFLFHAQVPANHPIHVRFFDGSALLAERARTVEKGT